MNSDKLVTILLVFLFIYLLNSNFCSCSNNVLEYKKNDLKIERFAAMNNLQDVLNAIAKSIFNATKQIKRNKGKGFDFGFDPNYGNGKLAEMTYDLFVSKPKKLGGKSLSQIFNMLLSSNNYSNFLNFINEFYEHIQKDGSTDATNALYTGDYKTPSPADVGQILAASESNETVSDLIVKLIQLGKLKSQLSGLGILVALYDDMMSKEKYQSNEDKVNKKIQDFVTTGSLMNRLVTVGPQMFLGVSTPNFNHVKLLINFLTQVQTSVEQKNYRRISFNTYGENNFNSGLTERQIQLMVNNLANKR